MTKEYDKIQHTKDMMMIAAKNGDLKHFYQLLARLERYEKEELRGINQEKTGGNDTT